MESGLAGARHQRYLSRAARLHAPACAETESAAFRGRAVPITAARAGIGGRPPGAGAGDRGSVCRRVASGTAGARAATRRDPMGSRDDRAVARASRCRHTRSGRRRIGVRRIRRHLSSIERPGGNGARPARLFRRRSGRDAVRTARRARPAAFTSRPTRDAGGRGARGNGPGEPVWGDAEVARPLKSRKARGTRRSIAGRRGTGRHPTGDGRGPRSNQIGRCERRSRERWTGRLPRARRSPPAHLDSRD